MRHKKEPTILLFISEIAPRVTYGTISCLQKNVSDLATIDNEMVLRMPGKVFPEKCAWAARINRDNVIAVTSGVNPKCTSSKGLRGSDKSIFDPMNQMVCVGTAGERELFFVGGIMLRIN